MDNIKKAVLNLDLLIGGVTTVIIVFITLAAVFMRKIMGQPFPWIEEVQLLLFIWAIFFGGSAAFRTGSHVGIDIIAERLNPGARKILDTFIFVVTTIVLGYFLWASYGLTINAAAKLTPYLRLPYPVIDAAAVIGTAVMLLQNTVYFVLKLQGKLPAEEGEA